MISINPIGEDIVKHTRLLFVAALALAGTVSAQIKIGYINSSKIMDKYPAAIDADKQLKLENDKWGLELQKMQEEFKASQEKLEQQSLLLSDEKKKEMAQGLQNLYTQMQQYQNEKWGEQGAYFKRKEELLRPILDKINAVIDAYGKRENYDIIFDTVPQSLVFAKDKYDITDLIMQELGKEKAAGPAKTQ
jgi:outer membrane protein